MVVYGLIQKMHEVIRSIIKILDIWSCAKQSILKEKAGLKLNIKKKTRIMASGPITLWQIEREEMEAVTDFILLGSKITVDGNCSHEIKRNLLLGRKTITNLDSVLKSRDVTLLTKLHMLKAIVFTVVTYRCESWTIKKAKC